MCKVAADFCDEIQKMAQLLSRVMNYLVQQKTTKHFSAEMRQNFSFTLCSIGLEICFTLRCRHFTQILLAFLELQEGSGNLGHRKY